MSENPLICVVDDEDGIRSLIKEALEMDGHTVEAFPDGESFLSFAERERPELVFLDINMEGLSGWEVQQEIAEDPELSSTAVVAVTAQGGKSVEASAVEGLGFDGYIRKPFELDELLSAAETELSKA